MFVASPNGITVGNFTTSILLGGVPSQIPNVTWTHWIGTNNKYELWLSIKLFQHPYEGKNETQKRFGEKSTNMSQKKKQPCSIQRKNRHHVFASCFFSICARLTVARDVLWNEEPQCNITRTRQFCIRSIHYDFTFSRTLSLFPAPVTTLTHLRQYTYDCFGYRSLSGWSHLLGLNCMRLKDGIILVWKNEAYLFMEKPKEKVWH